MPRFGWARQAVQGVISGRAECQQAHAVTGWQGFKERMMSGMLVLRGRAGISKRTGYFLAHDF